MTKYLIINADDFGYSFSINKGIIKAHTEGIVTSTSVLVNSIAANEAKELTRFSRLSIGLHFELTKVEAVKHELERQITKFISIVGKNPSHIDIHKRHTIDEGVKDVLGEYAKTHDVYVREFDAKHIDSFGINSHDCSVAQLRRSIDESIDGYNELMTHVGYPDDYLREHSSYNDPREQELQSVCNTEIKEYIQQKDITLINWDSLQELKV